jgi:transcriptional regulator with XRE-family HTH domain
VPDISDNIRKYRKQLRLTQREFANKLYVSKQAVSKWETGRGYPESSMIPKIAEVLKISIDKLMGVGFFNKKRIFMFSFIGLIVILIVTFLPSIISDYQEQKLNNVFIENLENQLNIELPNQVSLELSNYDHWNEYGNVFQISSMGYIIFNKSSQINQFETSLEEDIRWITELDDDLLLFMPSYVYNYKDSGDYFLVYNVNENQFNNLYENDQICEYIFLIYQRQYQRLIIFDYYI